MSQDPDHIRMSAALEEARAAALRDEVPIGAVLVIRETGEIAARAGNRTIERSDPTAHAEILVIREVCEKLGVQRLPEYDLYVTLEPCPMCAAAISFARIGRVIYGTPDPKSGGLSNHLKLYDYPQLHHKPETASGPLGEDCAAILREFFAGKRG